MGTPIEPSAMSLANRHLSGADVPLDIVVAAFKKLDRAEQVVMVAQLRIRKKQVSMQLIDLLFALAKHVKPAQEETFSLLADIWPTRRHEPGFAEKMRLTLCEQHFQ